MSKSNFIYNCHNVEDLSVVNKESFVGELEMKQCKLNNSILEKNKLQKELNNLIDYIEDKIQKYKTVTCQLTNNYDDLWNKYQNKTMELNENKNHKEHLSKKFEDLNRNTKDLECKLKDHKEKNEFLKSENYKLEKQINEEKEDIIFLEDQIQKQKQYLDKNDYERNKTTLELEEKTDDLNKEKEEHCILKSKTESLRCELSQKYNESKSEIFSLTENIKNLKEELEIPKRFNTELNEMLCNEKIQHEELTEVLKRFENEYENLKQATKKEKIKTNDLILKLRKENLNVQNEINDLKTQDDEIIENIEKLEIKNGNLENQVRTKELQCKLIEKNNDEKFKSLTAKLDCMQENKRKLENDLIYKTQTISELEYKLCQAEQMHKIECENACNLKIQLNNLKYKQSNMPINKCHQIANIESNCQFDNKCLDDIKSDCENLMTRIKLHDNEIDNSEESHQLYKNLIKKCNFLANYFNR